MNSFQYTAWTTEGLKQGLVYRTDVVEVAEWLESQGWVPVEVTACRERMRIDTTGRSGRGARRVDLVLLSRQLEVLLSSGVPLVRALSVTAEQTQNYRLSVALKDVADALKQGRPFSDGLEARPNVFPEVFVHFVRAGELGDRLPEMLARLGRLLEYECESLRKLKSPALLLDLPLLGSIRNKMAQSRFARILSALLASGIPLLTALEVSARASGSRAVANAVLKSRTEIGDGTGLAESLESRRVFSPLFLRLTAVGEETGNLGAQLDLAADYIDSEIELAIRNPPATIEQIILVAFGGFVLFMTLAVFKPLHYLAALLNG